MLSLNGRRPSALRANDKTEACGCQGNPTSHTSGHDWTRSCPPRIFTRATSCFLGTVGRQDQFLGAKDKELPMSTEGTTLKFPFSKYLKIKKFNSLLCWLLTLIRGRDLRDRRGVNTRRAASLSSTIPLWLLSGVLCQAWELQWPCGHNE